MKMLHSVVVAAIVALVVGIGCGTEPPIDAEDVGIDDAAQSDTAEPSEDAGDDQDVTEDTDIGDTPDPPDPPEPEGPVEIDVDFSGASLDVDQTEVVDDDDVRLVGRTTFYDEQWRWFSFRVQNAGGHTPEFAIETNFAESTDELHDHRVVYSPDGDEWSFFDNNDFDEDDQQLRFSNDDVFFDDEIYVAFAIPYTVADVEALIDDIGGSEWVEPTPSADDDLVVGTTPGGTDDLDRDVPSHNLYGFKITDSDASGPRGKVVLTGGIHSGEPTGLHVLDGFVRWATGDSSEAEAMRSVVDVYVYPMVNPDGFYAGLDRGTVARPEGDPNRVFHPDQWGEFTEVETVGTAMMEDTGGAIDYLVDFQSSMERGSHYAWLDLGTNPTGIEMGHHPFWQAFVDDTDASIVELDASLGFDTAMKFGWNHLGANFVTTFGTHHHPQWSISDYRELGASMGRALADAGDIYGPIEFDMDFDSGSLDVDNTGISGSTVQLAGRDNYNSGSWKWIYFRATNVLGEQLDFELGTNFAGGSGSISNHKFVYGYDQKNWEFFDHGGTSGSTYSFSNDGPFSRNVVYIAYGLPYPYEKTLELIDEVSDNPYVEPTASADSDFVIGQTAGGTDDIGRDIEPRDLFGFQITDPDASGSKDEIVVTSAVHANETHGCHSMRGFVDWVLGDSSEAETVRENAIIYVYPMVNADGRFAGYNRSTVETPGQDPNRQWSSSRWTNNQEIRITGQAMLDDTGGSADYVFDFHSWTGTGHHFAFIDTGGTATGIDMEQSTFWQTLTDLEPSLWARDSTFYGRTVMRFGRYELDADFAMTHETQFRPGENIDRYRDMGEHVGLSVYESVK